MKSIKPVQERVQLWYGDNDQMKNAAVGNLYENLDINPLAGCLPALAQIPIFLGVYYSVTSIAKAAIVQEGFLWIPNLSGPISDRRDGLTWLTDGWVDGVPRLGWEDTLAYLTIPVILVATQTLSLQLLGSFDAIDESKDDQKNVANALRFLPLMIGWFALNVPAGLGIYWVFNNAITTAQGWYIRQQFKPAAATAGASGSGSTTMFSSGSATMEKPKAKPSGFVVDDRLPKLYETPAGAKKDEAIEVKASSEDDESKSAAKKKAKAKAQKKKGKN